ncbi:glucokinase [Massilia sp. P8910]|uniref:glucokinase n=1 Tax=Massilia antarctica TaxID=2765360 RepID=UPI0006BB87F3|nr:MULTISPECIES: glucokinase [Massilia]MCE3603940.1 glucokinase [Massilia antarctica]MCY0911195.1 glucokinase [Massilia sp. H27-R4]CUI05214.1 Glucokinase [Janthinobacterium sp. CG23_2]CUU29000.1 Glucokinase [Janthinobacterium sp. CG23_2]
MTKEHDSEQKYSRTAYADGPRLLADIGATHARFALETAPGVLRSVRVLKCDDFPGIVPLLHTYLADHAGIRINHAAFALANPISGDMIRMTNRDWQFSTDEVRRELGLNTLLIVNDFTALAMSLPGLSGDDLMQVGGGTPATNAVIGVVGPGTGLGVSGMIPTVDGFVTLGSEGGHVNFAPADEREFAILQYAWKEWSHVSNERLISGPGMELIYRALAQRNGVQPTPRTSPEIIAGALDDNDPLCLEVLDCFCGMLGGAAANLAVTLGAFGGIFIGGGIVPRMGKWFATSSFRARFEAKGRFSSYLGQIPTYVIMIPNPAFIGVATILSEHLRGRSGANTLMERVQHLQHELSPAEQRVAALVLEHPRKVLGEPIAEIARLADVSQPTVIRFCRSLGFLGLADFKLKFASSLTGTIPVRHSQVRVSDSTHDLSAKVIDNTVSAILKFRDQLDVVSIDRAIALLRKANRVEFYAMGNSRVVALDGQHKFFRFRIPTSSYGDSHLFTLAAELLKPGDVVIAISTSGQLPELLAAVDAARATGADVIAITSSKSALAKRATICLAVDHSEDSTSFLSMISRVLQLLLIDILSVGISLGAQGADPADHEKKRSLISHLDI